MSLKVDFPVDAPAAFKARSRPFFFGRRHSRSHKSVASIRINVKNLAQLFNSLDPSPFWDRDLDRAAAEFIEDEFRDRRAVVRWHMWVDVEEGSTSAGDLQTALKSHYLRQANSARLAQREHLWVGELALLGGTIVFLLSMGARAFLATLHLRVPWFEEGLVILAWLALWRPAEALLYGWVPFFRQRRRYERLANVQVTVRQSASPRGVAAGRNAPTEATASNAMLAEGDGQ